jgi:hypothetical protein
MIASRGWLHGADSPLCSICQNERATVKSVITDPLIVSVSCYVCPSCYFTNASASAAIVAASPRLQWVEVAA